MPTLPGMNTDVYFGDANEKLPDWRDTPISPRAEAEAVKELLGFDPDELWSEEGEGEKGEEETDEESEITKDLPIDHPFPSGASQENIDPNGLGEQIHQQDELEHITNKAMETKSTILLYLARHGDTDRNNPDPSKDRIRAWDDVPLNNEGRKEALNLEKFFSDKDIENPIHSSDLIRAEETAFAIARSKGLELVVDKSLRPWDVGKYSGAISSQAHPVLEGYVRNKPDERVPSGKDHMGESFNEFKDRFLSYLKELFRGQERSYKLDPDTKPLLLMSHFRNLKCCQAWINNGAPDDLSIDIELFLMWKDLPPGSLIVVEDVGDHVQARVLEQ